MMCCGLPFSFLFVQRGCKKTIKFAAGGRLMIIFYITNLSLNTDVNCLLADDSHEISSLIHSEGEEI